MHDLECSFTGDHIRFLEGNETAKFAAEVPSGLWTNWITPSRTMRKIVAHFNPVKFDADQWVHIAKNAGMKYIVLTSKHHDGFCLWDSKVSDYNIMEETHFRRDIIKELAEACRKEG